MGFVDVGVTGHMNAVNSFVVSISVARQVKTEEQLNVSTVLHLWHGLQIAKLLLSGRSYEPRVGNLSS